MLKFELIQTYKQSIKILLRRKNLWFLSRTNLIKNRCKTLKRFYNNRYTSGGLPASPSLMRF